MKIEMLKKYPGHAPKSDYIGPITYTMLTKLRQRWRVKAILTTHKWLAIFIVPAISLLLLATGSMKLFALYTVPMLMFFVYLAVLAMNTCDQYKKLLQEAGINKELH